MAEAADPDALSPEAAQRFVDFARACKAAARIVTLYPAAHPAISASLGRIVELSNRATAEGPLRLTVLVDSMLIGGRMIAKPDPAIGELALLLHAHLVGELTVHSGADLESWRSFLLLLGPAPADVRAEGGIHRLWSTLG